MAICYLWKDGLFFCIGQWSWNQSSFSKDNEPWNWAETAVKQCSSYRNRAQYWTAKVFVIFSVSFLLPALPVGTVVFQMFCMYYTKNLMTFTSEILTKIHIKIFLKKQICKETSCCCSHELLDLIPTWIVILPCIFCFLLSSIFLFVLIFLPYYLLEKYSSQFKQFHCFCFLQENIRLSVFQSLGTEKPDGHLSRQSIWWLPAYLLAVDGDSSVLDIQWSRGKNRTLRPEWGSWQNQ